MRAAVARNGQVLVEDLDEPKPSKGEVLVASRGTGVCGSDKSVLERQARVPSDVGIVLGHEFCAEVVDYGSGTERTVPVGSLVCRSPFVKATTGFGVIGLSPTLPGAMAERFVLPASDLVAVGSGVAPLHATLAEPLAVGLRAVARAQLHQAGGPYLVVGCGPIGLGVIIALRQLGVGPIIASGHREFRRRLAELLGADVVIDPDVASPFDAWVEQGATAAPSPPLTDAAWRAHPPVIFDCVGRPGTLRTIIDGAVPGTHIIAVGACAADESIVPVVALGKQLSIEFCMAYTPAEFKMSLERLASGEVDAAPLITSVVNFDGAADLPALLNSEDEVKIIVDPGGS